MHSIFRKTTAAQPSPALSLAERLKAAQPAESPLRPSFHPHDGPELPYLTYAVTQADGVWVCCCGHENQLVHFAGAFPFKYLACGECDRVLCGECGTSGVLTPLVGVVYTTEIGAPGEEIRVCSVCSACGLSHRSVGHGGTVSPPEKCCCGNEDSDKWLQYRIGSVWGFRRDPVKAAHDVKHELTARKAEKVEKSRARKQLRTLDQWRAEESSQRQHRPEPLRSARFTQEMHWPPPSPAPRTAPLPPRVPAVQRLVDGDPKSTSCSLQRSGALRHKSSGPRTPRSATFDDRNPHTPHRDYFSLRRAATLATAEQHKRLDDEARSFIESIFGARTYKSFLGTPEEDVLVSIAREELGPEILGSAEPVQRTVVLSNNPDKQYPEVRRLMLARVETQYRMQMDKI